MSEAKEAVALLMETTEELTKVAVEALLESLKGTERNMTELEAALFVTEHAGDSLKDTGLALTLALINANAIKNAGRDF
jgi:hypothetical protein